MWGCDVYVDFFYEVDLFDGYFFIEVGGGDDIGIIFKAALEGIAISFDELGEDFLGHIGVDFEFDAEGIIIPLCWFIESSESGELEEYEICVFWVEGFDECFF